VAKPTILAVDEDAAVREVVDGDLRKRYGLEYRIVHTHSAKDALEILLEMRRRSEPVALLIADQRMPEMSGVAFLQEAIKLHPQARKVLLTAYADIHSAVDAINKVGIDHYLTKPWDPPEEFLYPVTDDLLEAWRTSVELPFEGIRVVGTMWSPECHEIKDFLARNALPYRWLDIERDDEGQALMASAAVDADMVPILFLPDGGVLVKPKPEEVAERTGLQTRAEQPFYDVIVIGSGPAGLSASVYASADGLRVLLVERHAPGGQAGNSPKIENFLGFPSGISGSDLTRRAVAQAKRFGTEILTTQEVLNVRVEGDVKVVTLDDGSEVSARMLLIATGAWFRTLDLPSAKRWTSAGLYYGAAHTEAAQCGDHDVVVIGAGNAAAQGMLHIASFARSVKVLIRGSEPTWSHYLDVAIRAHAKIQLLFGTELADIRGTDKHIREITIRSRDGGEERDLPCDAIFVFIGQYPQTQFLGDLVERTESGHILTGLDLVHGGKRPHGWPLQRDPLLLETSVPGIFAAGDCRNGTKHGVAAATGDGNVAVSSFWQYLSTV
jgi:thioredoxin reductase (NADPH)